MQDSIKLIKPDSDYKDSFAEAIEEFKRDWRNWFWNVGWVQLEKDWIENYINDTVYFERWEHLPEWRVASHTYRLVETDKKKFLGCINVRHSLNEYLEKYGGHIGYAIIPSERQKWYGSMILKLLLQRIAGDTWLHKVLLTCNEDNIASKKIIEKNRWVFENKILVEWKGYYKLRYWINC